MPLEIMNKTISIQKSDSNQNHSSLLLGIHCSVAGGLINAFNELEELEIDTFQIFTRNQRQWKGKQIEKEEGGSFRNQLSNHNINYAFSHCSYLINLASVGGELRDASINALTDEIIRCHELSLNYCVLHPGAAKDLGTNQAIHLIASGLNDAIRKTADIKVKILLENTAGQGSSIGYKFEHLRDIFSEVHDKERLGVCIDTCHAFAAGYDIRNSVGIEDMFAAFDKLIGIENLKVFHLNDSKFELGTRRDRHENIGEGFIGLHAFTYIMNHFKHIPKVIETPKEMDKENITLLRSLVY